MVVFSIFPSSSIIKFTITLPDTPASKARAGYLKFLCKKAAILSKDGITSGIVSGGLIAPTSGLSPTPGGLELPTSPLVASGLAVCPLGLLLPSFVCTASVLCSMAWSFKLVLTASDVEALAAGGVAAATSVFCGGVTSTSTLYIS